MRTVPDLNDKYDAADIEALKAEPWMLALLPLNPSYVHWGPHEDLHVATGQG